MDNLTHALVGATIGRAGADRTTPLATPTLVVAANAPDVDVLSYVGGPYAALAFRRGITHGVPALILWPFVIAGAVLAWDRWVRRRRRPEADPVRAGPILAWSAVGVWTHPALDWMNIYGMRWWLPFDGSWTYGDALFIIDPWLWLALGGALLLSRRQTVASQFWWSVGVLVTVALVIFGGGIIPGIVAGVIGGGLLQYSARRRRPDASAHDATAPRVALGLLAVYLLVMTVADRVATSEVTATAEQAGLTVVEVMVAPDPAVPTRSAVEVVTPTAIVPGSHSWLRSPRTELDESAAVGLMSRGGLSPVEARELVARARATPDAADFLTWSRFPYVEILEDPDGWSVRFSDARYDDRGGGGGLDGVTVGPFR